MEIAIVGTGYVGLVSGTCFSEMGINVYCIDTDSQKIENLKKGIIPIYEPGLDDMVIRNHEAGRLHFSTDLPSVINKVDIIFCAVGTPPGEDGSADLKYVYEVARSIGKHLKKYTLIVTKSTVPVGTSLHIKKIIQEELNIRELSDLAFDVASNPEFLKEGSAIDDFMHPDRVVVGTENDRAKEVMDRLYKPFTINNYRMIYTDIPSAEMIKYAANAMLATRISFMNDIANLCDLVGADVNMVRAGIGSDVRIGKKFLYPGCGYGGSCFPKDVKALIKTAEDFGYDMKVLKAVEKVNEYQKEVLFNKLADYYNNDLIGKKIALWGLSFKPKTDDIREAPSVTLINRLLDKGALVRAYDPVAMNETRKIFGDRVEYAKDIYDATLDADAIVLVTEWNEFRLPSWSAIAKLVKNRLVIDGRNIYNSKDLQSAGFEYFCIGAK
ncbi:UDP-glucose/GDP-mannose dehydrogenase family protein [Dysgonomonas sp. OttesenSCG-928-M03]|nr:UDP-glucose/GDP-mannose dehydrogenase family protein [Dysgonomonas sp. OttesenSCG-928-M03]